MIFRKPKVEETQPPAAEEDQAAETAQPEVQAAPPPAPAGETGASSVITSEVVMEGNLVTSGELKLDGTIHGAVQAQRIVVDVNGAVSGQVVAEEVIIRGRVIGPICGVRVHLLPGSQVEGDVMSQGIVVEDGAFIDGQIRHSEDPLGEWQQMYYGATEEDAEPYAGVVEEDVGGDTAVPGALTEEEDTASYLKRASKAEDVAGADDDRDGQDEGGEKAPSGSVS